MNDRMFDTPVFVKDGSTLIREIACVEDAMEFLYEWPEKRRGSIYDAAIRACQRALSNSYPAPDAKKAFAAFAKSANVLEEVDTPLPWMIVHPAQSGGMSA